MSDFTAFNLQDHYRAVVDQREREIASASWRRAWMKRGEGAKQSRSETAATRERGVQAPAMRPNP